MVFVNFKSFFGVKYFQLFRGQIFSNLIVLGQQCNVEHVYLCRHTPSVSKVGLHC